MLLGNRDLACYLFFNLLRLFLLLRSLRSFDRQSLQRRLLFGFGFLFSFGFSFLPLICLFALRCHLKRDFFNMPKEGSICRYYFGLGFASVLLSGVFAACSSISSFVSGRLLAWSLKPSMSVIAPVLSASDMTRMMFSI